MKQGTLKAIKGVAQNDAAVDTVVSIIDNLLKLPQQRWTNTIFQRAIDKIYKLLNKEIDPDYLNRVGFTIANRLSGELIGFDFHRDEELNVDSNVGALIRNQLIYIREQFKLLKKEVVLSNPVSGAEKVATKIRNLAARLNRLSDRELSGEQYRSVYRKIALDFELSGIEIPKFLKSKERLGLAIASTLTIVNHGIDSLSKSRIVTPDQSKRALKPVMAAMNALADSIVESAKEYHGAKNIVGTKAQSNMDIFRQLRVILRDLLDNINLIDFQNFEREKTKMVQLLNQVNPDYISPVQANKELSELYQGIARWNLPRKEVRTRTGKVMKIQVDVLRWQILDITKTLDKLTKIPPVDPLTQVRKDFKEFETMIRNLQNTLMATTHSVLEDHYERVYLEDKIENWLDDYRSWSLARFHRWPKTLDDAIAGGSMPVMNLLSWLIKRRRGFETEDTTDQMFDKMQLIIPKLESVLRIFQKYIEVNR